MTVYKSVWISCDACDDEIQARGGEGDDDAMVIGDGEGFVSATALRAEANRHGWGYARGRDICPAHRDAGAR